MPDADEPPGEPIPQPRPAPIELAAAILIVGGVLGLVGLAAAASDLPPGTEPLLVVTGALDIGAVVIGVLIRFGRAWLVAINYVAVLGFLDLMAAGGSGLALILGVADVLVVIILFLHKPWFDGRRRIRDAREERDARRTGPPAGR
jgi:uncharacterized membrane protein